MSINQSDLSNIIIEEFAKMVNVDNLVTKIIDRLTPKSSYSFEFTDGTSIPCETKNNLFGDHTNIYLRVPRKYFDMSIIPMIDASDFDTIKESTTEFDAGNRLMTLHNLCHWLNDEAKMKAMLSIDYIEESYFDSMTKFIRNEEFTESMLLDLQYYYDDFDKDNRNYDKVKFTAKIYEYADKICKIDGTKNYIAKVSTCMLKEEINNYLSEYNAFVDFDEHVDC